MKYDITFIGHVCLDRISPYEGEEQVAPGSAVLCGAMAAARIGKKVAVITRMHPDNDSFIATGGCWGSTCGLSLHAQQSI